MSMRQFCIKSYIKNSYRLIVQFLVVVSSLSMIFSLVWLQSARAETVASKIDATSEAQPLHALPKIQYWQVHQIPVYFVYAPEVPMVIINVLFTAGSAYDQSQWGLARLTADLLDQGTQQYDADQIANGFAQVGAQYTTTVNRDMAVISLQSLSAHPYVEPALQWFINVLTQPQFSPSAFSRQQQLALARIKQDQEDPAKVATKQFYTLLYQRHPYAHPVDGTLTSVQALHPADAKNFYQHYYVAQNAKIVIVGDFSRAQAQAVAWRIASHLPNGEVASSLSPASITPPTLPVVRITYPAVQTTMILGQLGMDYNDPDFFPLLVGNDVLGGLPLDSLLFQRVRREAGLAYDVVSNFSLARARGPFVLMLQTRAEKAEQALKMTQQTLTTFIQQGPSESQLRAAQQLIINSFPINLATDDDIDDILINIATYQRPLNYLETYRDRVRAVTTDEVKQAFARHIQPGNMLTVIVGPVSELHAADRSS